VAIIQLEENVKMISNIIGCDPEAVEIGMKVGVCFNDVTKDITLPKFKPI